MLYILLFISLVVARPQRPPMREGEVRDFKGQRKFSYDSTKLKTSTANPSVFSQEPIMKYDIEMVEHYHSLDDEEIIDDVKCTKDAIEVMTTEELHNWKEGDVFTGGEMWQCQHELMRKVKKIALEGKVDGMYKYVIQTEKAELKDLFAKADVDVHFPTADELKEKEEATGNRKMKKSDQSVEFISPTEETVVDSEIGLEVAFSIKGCDAVTCGTVTVKAHIYANDHIWPFSDTLRTTFVATCSADTDYNCRYLIPMKNDNYGYDEENYVEFEFYKFGEKFLEEEIDFITNDVKFIFELPLKGTVLSMGDALNITWDVTSATVRKFQTIPIQFYRKVDWWFDSKVIKINVPTTNYKWEYILTEANGFEKGKTYYMEVDLDNGEDYESHPFTISDGSDSIQIITPDCTTFVSKGEKLTIGWEYKNPLSSNIIKVRLVRGISFWPDDTVYENENVDMTNTELTIDIGSMKESTKYYIEIEYQAEGKKHYAYSDYFTYATKKFFTVLSSTTNEDSRRVTINMKVNEYVGKYYVSVHQKFPVFSMLDYEIEGTQQKEITEYNVGQTYSQTFQYTQGTPFRAYVEFRYKCLYKDHLCEEEKYYITDVPYEETLFEWNYNSLTHTVSDTSLDIMKYDCQNGVNTENIGPSFKDICGKLPGFDFEFSATCENCYVFAPLKAFGFELLINAGYAYKAKLNLQADLEMNLDLLTTFRGEYHFNYDTKLTDKLSFKIRIPLGPVVITIQPGMQFFFGFDFDTVIMLEAEASFTKQYTLLLSFDSTKPTLKDQFAVTTTDLSPEKAMQAHISGNVDINIQPMIIANFWLDCKCYGVSFIEGDIGFKFGVDIDVGAQYPAYPVDNIYSSDYPYYIRMDLSFFILMNYKVTIFSNVLAEQQDYDILGSNLKYKWAFAKTKKDVTAVSMSLPISSTYGRFSALEHSTMKYEIGQMARDIGKVKYGEANIDEYLVNGEFDEIRSTGLVNYYNYHAFDTKVTYKIMEDVKTCITGGSCVVPITADRYPTISKVMGSILPCQKTECMICSLDETTCV